MKRRQKNALIAVMSLSLMTMGTVVTKISLIFIRMGIGGAVTSYGLQRYFQSLVHLVANIEQALIITLGCVPALRLARLPKVPSVNEISTWLHSLIQVRSFQGSKDGSHRSGRSRQSSNDYIELAQRRKGEEADTISKHGIVQRTEFRVERS
ncbi:hypothetical protein PG994_008912 [Apiospora phragmitis]|uniref:Uncharacterized protein n=1 Tax=Apiospora phragmitis TaxID=2905665 RepID=A0ABR1UHT5_9PEZI